MNKMPAWIRKNILKLYAPLAAAFIAFSWNWYHLSRHDVLRFTLTVIISALAVWLAFFIFKRTYIYLTARFNRHSFWQNDFFAFLDELLLLASLFFAVFLIRTELYSLAYFSLVLLLLYARLDSQLGKHPAGNSWRTVGRSLFILSIFIFPRAFIAEERIR